MSKNLIAYYSRAGENYINGSIKNIKTGNTEEVANIINKLINCDIFKIEQKAPYSSSYKKCTEEAKEDQINNRRPELKAYLDSIDEYKTIYLGFPNYWSTIPMALFTFLEHYSFKGKTIKPFCTHEGSGLGSSMNDIKKLCPDADVKEGLAIRGSNANRSKEEIEKWIKK